MRKPLLAIFILVCSFAAAAADAKNVPPPGETPAPETGNADTGRTLFYGTSRFVHGGAPCIACHAISGAPGGGGTLGPDLSQVYTDYGEEAIAPVLAELPFPSMTPIYETRPLTPEEQAHIMAFLRVSAEGEPAGNSGGFLLFGIAGGVFGIGLSHVVWRKRLSEVRRPFLRGTAGPGRGDA